LENAPLEQENLSCGVFGILTKLNFDFGREGKKYLTVQTSMLRKLHGSRDQVSGMPEGSLKARESQGSNGGLWKHGTTQVQGGPDQGAYKVQVEGQYPN
jgi:hypothetical protein